MPRRVLCIEGDAEVRARVKTRLEREGFTVDTSASGLEGIERALTSRPDLIVADVHLPDLEGFELTARLKREKALEHVPIVAVGESRDEHDDAIAAGADGFVDRAADDGQLGAELLEYMDGKRERLTEQGERERLRTLSGTMAAHLEAALTGARRANARLLELDELKSAFMHNLAHELSTPLTPLAGYLRILSSEKLGPMSPQQKRIVDSMIHSVTRLARVVDNLSDFASLQAGESPIMEGAVNPDQLADEVVAEQRPMIRDARLHVVVAHAGGEPVIADPRKLRQAIANIVSNAVKFSPHGGEVLVEVTRQPGKLRYTVYDQGPGIRSLEQERIFEPLHHARARGTDEARLPGSGLGLPVARRIAEAHGGRVWVESPPRTQPGSLARQFTGSKFVLEIPVRPADQPTAGKAPSAASLA
ncbi:hybrid sensor histidine kinase/response regulator [Anaeromyxobacter sp. Fw109-5]|uniref:hybrid sensor histidine kinase/response regulator n=1 Tax=Anaeromyxobacter sp. (strain Fw109-5) TaxID=404589 RepID=UPI0000ED75C0|nr:hybrid sensor histidine kinase/response regulator [Anaeromyxobacter sp. Fw109-5]ABS26554.1 response regulator receiver sensor signal transduction histidine kinase [Anaeromyxobacter sp. Fw109-5]